MHVVLEAFDIEKDLAELLTAQTVKLSNDDRENGRHHGLVVMLQIFHTRGSEKAKNDFVQTTFGTGRDWIVSVVSSAYLTNESFCCC